MLNVFPWIVADVSTHCVYIDSYTKVVFQIWDTAGQERFGSLAPLHYRDSHGAIVVYDISSQTSFSKAQNWVRKLRCNRPASMVIALTGNKQDVIDSPSWCSSDRQVETDDARAFAEKHNLLFFETSAKTGEKVTELFDSVAKKIVVTGGEVTERPSISLHEDPEHAAHRRNCCQ